MLPPKALGSPKRSEHEDLRRINPSIDGLLSGACVQQLVQPDPPWKPAEKKLSKFILRPSSQCPGFRGSEFGARTLFGLMWQGLMAMFCLV